ncbi:MAG TPA: CBS domain-containing protein [Thermoanaerobaculia bacterium]|nr:CBS domain-containing protein [Thermoanaerobaculia bacterium]
MDLLLQLAQKPPVATAAATSVFDAVTLMSKNRVGAIAIVEGGELRGIFTERDVMEKVVLHSLDPKTTPLRDVMTATVLSIRSSDDPQKALETMVDRHIRHLAVTDDAGKLVGMLSIRNVLQNQLERARSEADSLEAYMTADGPGG